MVKKIEAKSILSYNKHPSHWFGVRYVMNIYRGCEHGCIYCDSRSECYGIRQFEEITIKSNAIDLLKEQLPYKRKRDPIGTGSMSDPYTPVEKEYQLTRQALELLAAYRYPVHITTKSNLILRDIHILQEINRIHASTAITLTTVDDTLSKKIEPKAPASSDRLKAIGILSAAGICAGITMMPILPFIEDNEKNITEIVKAAKEYGANFIYPGFGVTLRDRQREYYYNRLDELFPGMRLQYERRYQNQYVCRTRYIKHLKQVFYNLCEKYGISTKMPMYQQKVTAMQMSLFEPQKTNTGGQD